MLKLYSARYLSPTVEGFAGGRAPPSLNGGRITVTVAVSSSARSLNRDFQPILFLSLPFPLYYPEMFRYQSLAPSLPTG